MKCIRSLCVLNYTDFPGNVISNVLQSIWQCFTEQITAVQLNKITISTCVKLNNGQVYGQLCGSNIVWFGVWKSFLEDSCELNKSIHFFVCTEIY